MTNKKKLSFAEQIDKMMQRIALGTFLVAVAYAIVTAKFIVTEETGDVLNIIAKVLGVLIIVLILPTFIKFVNMRRKNREGCREPEGFVIEMFNKATGKAFQFTFLFLIFFELVSKFYLTHLPGEFFIKVIVSVTLGIFSITFFFLNRAGDIGEGE
ncbi:MAG: hypothetical protein V3R64_05500 [Sphingomonadales bacterium]